MSHALRVMLDWLMVKHHKMVVLRYASMNFGDQCVMPSGTSETLMLCVNNWGIMEVRMHNFVSLVTREMHFFTFFQHLLRCKDTLYYQMHPSFIILTMSNVLEMKLF